MSTLYVPESDRLTAGDRLLPAERTAATDRAVGDLVTDRRHGLRSAPGRPPLDVLVVASEAPPIVSGISRCIGRLESGLRARGATVEVVSAVQMPRIAVGEWRFSSFLAHWPGLVRKMREVDVVNVHGPVPTLSDLFLRLVDTMPEHSRPAVVYTHHSPIDLRGLKLPCRVYNALHGGLARRADAIVASSEHYARQLSTRYGPTAEAIPWGVDLPTRPRSAPRATDGPLKVLFVGQMRAYKGVEVLLRAVAGLPGVEVTLVGSGPRLEHHRQLARELGADDSVRFTGRVDDEELAATYAASDVVVLPSVNRAEAFGLVLLEGMAAGCVPVASDLPGVRDVAGGTGLVVEPGDPSELRAALAGLAADRTRLAEMQDASEARAAGLSWDDCVDAYYDTFLAAARRRYRRLQGDVHPRLQPVSR